MAIGDINSSAPGSGARFNDGKPDLALIPANIIGAHHNLHPSEPPEPDIARALLALGMWQFRESTTSVLLHEALWWSGASWEQIARVFEYGKRKYAAWNWAKGMPWSVPTASAMRHALAVLRGEENDPESGLPHIGHFGCNMIMLLHYAGRYEEGDDRPANPANPANPVHPAMNSQKLWAVQPPYDSRAEPGGFNGMLGSFW